MQGLLVGTRGYGALYGHMLVVSRRGLRGVDAVP